MALQGDIGDREYQKFIDVAPYQTAVRVNNFITDIDWDEIVPTFNATSDVYEFYKSSVLQKTITINYVDATKEVMSSITKV